jgi:hypothetical protein
MIQELGLGVARLRGSWLQMSRSPSHRQVDGVGRLAYLTARVLQVTTFALCVKVVGNKRARDVCLATSVPLSVWQEHLTPWLSPVEAARLRGACKALKGVMDECPVDLGDVRSYVLNDALTCFPAAPSLEMVIGKKLPASRKTKLVQLLRQHGGRLKRVTAEGEGAQQVLDSALRASALPKLTYFEMIVSDREHRQWLSDGRLRLLEEVHAELTIAKAFPSSMEHLRQLPHLRDLTIRGLEVSIPAAVFPAFIPPSLKTLTLDHLRGPVLESLLLQLPPMLQASGAGLEELQVISSWAICAESGVALARVLHTCSSTLKIFSVIDTAVSTRPLDRPCADEVALGLVSCCEGLERLEVPWEVFSRLPPTCPPFARLTHLRVTAGAYDPIDLASPVWNLVASGLLPALADLHLEGRKELSWERDGGCRLARALEGMAGTLRQLTLKDASLLKAPPSAACHELGLAVGKLRRLTFLSLQVSEDGRSYEAMGRGLAASGGCPLLSELRVNEIKRNLGCLAFEPSLIVPTVRNLHISAGIRGKEEEALVLYSGLVQMGYKPRLTNSWISFWLPMPKCS